MRSELIQKASFQPQISSFPLSRISVECKQAEIFDENSPITLIFTVQSPLLYT